MLAWPPCAHAQFNCPHLKPLHLPNLPACPLFSRTALQDTRESMLAWMGAALSSNLDAFLNTRPSLLLASCLQDTRESMLAWMGAALSSNLERAKMQPDPLPTNACLPACCVPACLPACLVYACAPWRCRSQTTSSYAAC